MSLSVAYSYLLKSFWSILLLLHVLNFAWPPVRIHYPDNTACGHRLARLVSVSPPPLSHWRGDMVLVCVYKLYRKHLRALCAPLCTSTGEQFLCSWTYPGGFTQL